MNRILLFFLLLTAGLSVTAQTDTSSLATAIRQVIAGKSAHVGVAITAPDGRELLTINGKDHYPMMSVFKFPLAVYVLHKVEAGELSLDHVYAFRRASLAVTFSPMRDDHKGKDFKLILREILAYTVSKSDNNGCDFLFQLIGGPEKVNSYIHSLGILDIQIASVEGQMAKSKEAVYGNWVTPSAANRLLQVVFEKHVLAPDNEKLLWSMMLMTNVTIKDRLCGPLPAGTVVAHKTGTGATYEGHLNPAINDIGWIVLPDGRRFILSVLVTDTREEDAVNARIIAEIAKAAWDYFNGASPVKQ